MKRCITLVAAAALILGLAATASAELEVKAAGAWRVSGQALSNFGNFDDDTSTTNSDTFTLRHRMRTQLRFVYNENVMGELYTEYGNVYWGRDAAAYGAGENEDGNQLHIKRAFIQFRWPETDTLITVGEQDITFPSSGAFSNMAQGGDDGSAIAVSTPITDNLGLTLVYTRLLENAAFTSGNDFDVFLAALPVALDGMKIAPWFSYGIAGQNVNGLGVDINTDTETANVWWAGAGFNMDMLDPIVIYADFIYGSADDGYATLDDGTDGWMADVMVEFKGLDFAVLQGFGAYSSQNDDGDGAMPYIDSDFTVGGSMINGSAFGIDMGPAAPGFWLVGAAARKISFIEKLSHDVIVMYAKGTTDSVANAGFQANRGGSSLPALTSDDSYLEADFNTRYQIYESLAAIVELGYGKPDFDRDQADDALMKAAFGFIYAF
ncbi:outer membrane homotrimeric porin [Desulfocurvibacter africanus]|uniref:outer membrane homotrimeric porin n=1 Tax=Desulfocurvibacter africanus TaxID=873 RepID=UPI002FDB02F9